MKKTQTKGNNYHQIRFAAPALLGLALFLAGSGLMQSVAAGSNFNNVQVFVNTSSQLPYSYTFTAYNLTGSLIGTYQGNLPAAAFGLPAGDYLFTVSTVYQIYGPCYQCVYATNSGAPTPPGSSSAYPV
jgi:hypothetical protein